MKAARQEAYTLRRPLLARVHVARKELALAEDSYRSILIRLTGHSSAADLGVAELKEVLREFTRLGLRPHRKLSSKPHVRKIYALWVSMKPYLTDPSREALRAFVARQTGVADPEWLTAAQANKVTEGLKAWKRREEVGDAADV
jgi:phage gp16-like protein